MTIATSMWPQVAGLVEAEKMDGMGANRRWTPKNDLQALFLEKYFLPLRNSAAKIPEITSVVSRSAEVINKFLADNGFTIELDPFSPQGFGTASILDLLLKWRTEGEVRPIVEAGTDKVHTGVRIDGEDSRFYFSDRHPFWIAGLATKTKDVAYMTVAHQAPRDEFELMGMIENIESGVLGSKNSKFAGVVYPMVDLQKIVDISFLIGMETVGNDGDPAIISQALLEVIEKINQLGSRTKVAFAAGIEKCCAKPTEDLEITQPFFYWIRRPGLKSPLVCAYLTPEVWNDPGNIEA